MRFLTEKLSNVHDLPAGTEALDAPCLERFEHTIFKTGDVLNHLLSFGIRVLEARQAGLVLGTDRSGRSFLPPERWDRGVLHRLDGKGIRGWFLKYLGVHMVRLKGLSPIRLYRETQYGEKIENDGIIAFVIRAHRDFYAKGLKLLIIDIQRPQKNKDFAPPVFSIWAYNGESFQFQGLPVLKVNAAIVRQFNPMNFISAYVPDYGAIVFSTIHERLLKRENQRFLFEDELKARLNTLIFAIETASIAYIGSAKGRRAAHLIWRKEKTLRKAAQVLKHQEMRMDRLKGYLRAVGAVDEKMLHMDPVSIVDGVYAFVDMAASAAIRKRFQPRDYFLILNLCHQIAADNAGRFCCRVDNFIGDAVFILNASPFDQPDQAGQVHVHSRIMQMVFAVSSILNDIQKLKSGLHEMDQSGQVRRMMQEKQVDFGFRAGMDLGPAVIGPLGSRNRKIVTAIGKAVNTASRLERTGVTGSIHLSAELAAILQEAYITRDTGLMWHCLMASDFSNFGLKNGDVRFLDFFSWYFEVDKDLILEQKAVSYKEFSSRTSFLIQCLPESVSSGRQGL